MTAPLSRPVHAWNKAQSWWRRWLWLQFRLFQSHRFNQLTIEHIAGKPFLILPTVFNPKLFWTGAFLAQSLNSEHIPAGSMVLDMGCGSGVGAVFAAQWAQRVVAVDLNPEAVRCTRINALLNGVERRVDALEGDLFHPVGNHRFDTILFNPPYLRGLPQNALEQAFWSEDIIPRFLSHLGEHLSTDGIALILLSTLGDLHAFRLAIEHFSLTADTIAEKSMFGETIYIYRLSIARSREVDG